MSIVDKRWSPFYEFISIYVYVCAFVWCNTMEIRIFCIQQQNNINRVPAYTPIPYTYTVHVCAQSTYYTEHTKLHNPKAPIYTLKLCTQTVAESECSWQLREKAGMFRLSVFELLQGDFKGIFVYSLNIYHGFMRSIQYYTQNR